jgi:hypothetical protein
MLSKDITRVGSLMTDFICLAAQAVRPTRALEGKMRPKGDGYRIYR